MKRGERLVTGRPIGQTVRTFRAIVAAAVAITIGGLGVPSSAQTGYRFTTIVDKTGVPIGVGALNNIGEVVFIESRVDNSGGPFGGVYRTSAGGPIVTIAESLPGSEVPFSTADINDAGTVAFQVSNRDASTNIFHTSIFTGNGGPLTTIFSGFQTLDFPLAPSINNSGTVAFRVDSYREAAEAGSFHLAIAQTIFSGDGSTRTTIYNRTGIVESDQFFSVPAINASGLVAFSTAGQVTTPEAVYIGNGGPLTTLIREGDSTSLGSVIGFSRLALNDSGAVAVTASATPDGGQTTESGLFLVSGGSISLIAKGGGGELALNNAGQFASLARLEDASGALVTGIFVGPLTGADPIRDRIFDPLDETVFGSRIIGFDGTNINDRGEIAFTVVLANPADPTGDPRNFIYRIILATPQIRWKNAADGSFQAPDNWDPRRVPTGTDNATFDEPGTYTVTLDADVAHGRVFANGAGTNVTFDLNGFDYVLDEINIGGEVGDNVSVTFEDAGGPVVSAASAAAGDGLAQAAANGGAVRRLRARLLKAGNGGLADVTIPISTLTGRIDTFGIVKVFTTNGNWDVPELTVGSEGGGYLAISRGGNVFSQLAVLGEKAGPNVSIVDVDGQGSNWDNQTLVVGERGTAIVNITDKGLVGGRHIVVGDKAGSSGDINILNASLIQNANDDLTIGSRGRGKLDVTNGSLVEAGLLAIGLHSTGEGEVTVGSFGELNVDRTLSVGVLGTALLAVDGGRVQRDGPIGSSTIGSNGILRVLNGHFYERNELTVNGALGIHPSLGSASIGQSPIENPGFLTIGSGGILAGNGLISGLLDDFPASVNNFQGIVSPGNSPGTLTIDGDYEQIGGLLGIEIAGTAPGQFDVLAVTGNAMLGGTLLLEFIDGFAPRQGDVFEFLDIGGALGGAFANVEVRNLLPGFQFDLRPDAGGLTMVALNDGVFVPEPSLAALLLFPALIAISYVRKRR